MDQLSEVLRAPVASDDKYSRGVVGFVTGSNEFPGAAILGVTAAIRTGIGMVRWIGPESVGRMLIEVRPEVVLQNGRAQCWVVGSGIRADDPGQQGVNLNAALDAAQFAVIDAGALELVDFSSLAAASVLTPHAGELERLLGRFNQVMTRTEIEQDPLGAAKLAARLTGQVVLLKGNVTTIADSTGNILQTPPASPALATAGSGDVLAGILGALIASNVDRIESAQLGLSRIAVAAAILHAKAAALAFKDGPIAAMDIAESIRTIVGGYLA
jgi:hydroxyethylthiazole kinase-like uncharacterized protein yjeF